MDRCAQPKVALSPLQHPFSSFFKLPFELLMLCLSFLGLFVTGSHVDSFMANSVSEYKSTFCVVNILLHWIEHFRDECFNDIRRSLINRHNIQSVFVALILAEHHDQLVQHRESDITRFIFQGGMFTSIARWLNGELVAIKDIDVFFGSPIEIIENFASAFANRIATAVMYAKPMFLAGLDGIVKNCIRVEIFNVYSKYGIDTKKCRVIFERDSRVVGHVDIDLNQYIIEIPKPLFTYRLAWIGSDFMPKPSVPYKNFDKLLEHLLLNSNMNDPLSYAVFDDAIDDMNATLACDKTEFAGKLHMHLVGDLVRMRIPVQLQHAIKNGFCVKQKKRNFLETLHDAAVFCFYTLKLEAFEYKWLEQRRDFEFVLGAEMAKLFEAKKTIMKYWPKRAYQPITTNSQLHTNEFAFYLLHIVAVNLQRLHPYARMRKSDQGMASYACYQSKWDDGYIFSLLYRNFSTILCIDCRRFVKLDLLDLPSVKIVPESEACRCTVHCMSPDFKQWREDFEPLLLHIPFHLEPKP